jgi:hypothetical protein
MHFGSAVHVAVGHLSQTLLSLVFFPLCWPDIVFRLIMEYSSLRDFGPQVIIDLFLYEDF